MVAEKFEMKCNLIFEWHRKTKRMKQEKNASRFSTIKKKSKPLSFIIAVVRHGRR